jgi:hypothetical protein
MNGNALVLGALLAVPLMSDEIPKGIEWVNDWDRALATAADRGVPVIVSFANED